MKVSQVLTIRYIDRVMIVFLQTWSRVTKMNDLWEQIQERIKQEITPINYAIWMHSITKVLETDDVLILRSPNRHFTDHVQKNYLPTIVRVLKEVSGRSYTIQFQEEVSIKIL